MGLREALEEQAAIWEGYTSDDPDTRAVFELAAGKLRELLAAEPAPDGQLSDAAPRPLPTRQQIRDVLDDLTYLRDPQDDVDEYTDKIMALLNGAES